MLRFANLLGSFVASECGGDLIEYALLAALLALIVVQGFNTFLNKHVLKLYTTIATDLKKDFKQ